MKEKGFTLIEILIVLVIIAILASVALPSYQSSVSKGRRADAQAALLGLSQAMERHFTQNTTYATAITGTAPKPPNIFPSQIPVDGAVKFYNIVVTAVTANTYTLQAQPIAGTAQENDGILQLNHLGARVWDRDDDGDLTEATDLCWTREC